MRNPARLMMSTAALSTWQPTSLPANIALSNGNRTATHDGTSSTAQHVCGTRGLSTGKRYFELTTGSIVVGVDPTGANGSALLGVGALSVGWNLSTGAVVQNSSTVATGWDTTSSGVVQFALDLTNHLLWGRKVGGNWNGSPSNDPATGVGGLNIGGTTWFPAMSSAGPGGAATLNVGQEPFGGSRPTGFFIWE